MLQYVVKGFLLAVNYKIFYVSPKLEEIQGIAHNMLKSSAVFDRHPKEK